MTFLFLTQWLTRCENSHPRFHLNLDLPSGQNRDFLILGQVWCLLSLRRPGAPWLDHFSTSPARNPGEVSSAKHHLSSFQRIIKVPFLGPIRSLEQMEAIFSGRLVVLFRKDQDTVIEWRFFIFLESPTAKKSYWTIIPFSSSKTARSKLKYKNAQALSKREIPIQLVNAFG